MTHPMTLSLRSAAQQALAALEYHQQQTRPISQSEDAIKALRVALAEPTVQPADLFWNDDDAEIGYTSIDDMLNSVWEDGLLEVGAEFTVQQAISLPKIKVRVTVIDEENGLEYIIL